LVDDLNERDQEEHISLAFKTPQKKKQVDILKGALTIPSFAKAIEVIDELVNPEVTCLDIKELNHRSLEMHSFVEGFLSHFEQKRATSLSYFESNDVRMNHFNVALGSKPKGLDARFEAPNLWLIVGSVANEVSNLSDTYSNEINLIGMNYVNHQPALTPRFNCNFYS